LRRENERLKRNDQRLEKSGFLAGEEYSMADITRLVTVDFSAWIKMDATANRPALAGWYREVSMRKSASA
jgi:glutathione S-transferase